MRNTYKQNVYIIPAICVLTSKNINSNKVKK